MKKIPLGLIFFFILHIVCVLPILGNQTTALKEHSSLASSTLEAQAAFQYFLDEVELDPILTFKEQHEKIEEFKFFADGLSPEAASYVTTLLLDETRLRVLEMLQTAGLEKSEVDEFLEGYDQAIQNVENMTVEIAREMLFFVAELKIHRQYVYDFGIALGAPEKQLLLHDLCKLEVDQFEGYARYYRGGRREEDKPAYLAAWAIHQHEEHHHESYSKEGFDFDNFPEERLSNNMLESVSDLLASTKQRGGGTLIDWLVNSYPKKNPHPRLLPFFEEALKKAHAFYLDSEENPDSEYKIFQGVPSWNSDVEEVFRKMRTDE